MAREIRLKDAVYTWIAKSKQTMFAVFWSSKWHSRTPWRYKTEITSYFDTAREETDNGHMIFVFLGPVMIIHYRKKSQ